ncbi:hypothetical protein [Pseudomonas sp. RIT-PI-S]|uniref:hypothetical protein n=1 Tax=Pseudomonas sp. RIT-PI-S TaxID=3035295 RepID=UPI0021DA50DA|nr:hypothetical protein [Pseudomonas sp. RIT-PI-S]
MKQRNYRVGALLALAAWVAMAYAVRYGLMEHTAWVGACAEAPERLPCQVRAGLGLMIHWAVLPCAGLALAALGWVLSARRGRIAAAWGLVLAVPGLVLYTTSLAAVAVMLAGLRLARTATPSCGLGQSPRTSP